MSKILTRRDFLKTSALVGGALAAPSADSVQEFQIMRNAFDARFGRTGGGVISMVTRGGSQDVHFSAWEYLRNYKLDANQFFNNRNGVAKGVFRRNTFGGNLGAPIWKAKRIYGPIAATVKDVLAGASTDRVFGYDYFRTPDAAGNIVLAREEETWFSILPSVGAVWSGSF